MVHFDQRKMWNKKKRIINQSKIMGRTTKILVALFVVILAVVAFFLHQAMEGNSLKYSKNKGKSNPSKNEPKLLLDLPAKDTAASDLCQK